MTGLTLAQYRIVDELGRGGMGIVYKATDTKLNRTVALKVLPASALASEDDRARFFREAQSAAALHHPNIATVFQIDEAVPTSDDGGIVEGHTEPRLFIAMEFIEGETLYDRIKKGPFPLKDAVSVAGQIAEALKEAHAKEIVHRDIKSHNVMLTGDGIAKVLDFGLAKTNQSTMLTRMGSTLGTVAYMSPEQARGQEVDGRTDLYALGTVLYEMVAGQLPFAGDYEQAVLYSILNEPPEPLTALRTGVPMELERITSKLLSKEAEYRYQSAAGLLADLKSLDVSGPKSMQSRSGVLPIPGSSAKPELPRKGALPILAAALGALIVGGIAGWVLRAAPSAEMVGPVVRSTIDVVDGDEPAFALSISRAGGLLAYKESSVGVGVRDLQTGESWAIPDTENYYEVAFNDDGSWLLLSTFGRVVRSPVRGGRPIEVVDTQSRWPFATWGPDESVVYVESGRIMRMPLGGVDPEVLLRPDSARGELGLSDPSFDPAGTHLFAEILSDDNDRIGVWAYPSLERVGEVEPGGEQPVYLPSGHLVYNVDGELLGRPFDLDAASPLGPPAPLASEITERAWSVSSQGTFVSAFQTSFSSSGAGSAQMPLRVLRWGEPETLLSVEHDEYQDMDLHSDGRRLVTEIVGNDQEIWVADLETGVRNQITFGQGDDASWIPGSDSVLYVVRGGGSGSALHVRAADGSGNSRILLEHDLDRFADPVWSPTEGLVLYTRNGDQTDGVDIWQLDPTTGQTSPAIGGRDYQDHPRFSPDGRYVLYCSAESGMVTIFVQPTAPTGGRWDISRGMGRMGRWAPDGSAIYYATNTSIMRVDIESGDGFAITGNPVPEIEVDTRVSFWTLLSDGSGAIVVRNDEGVSEGGGGNIPVDLVHNWFVEVEEKAPHPR